MSNVINLRIGISDDTSKGKILREAVRCVIFKEKKILLLKTKYGDYKLPGGGVEKGESYETSIIRELQEETGYECKKIIESIGLVVERKIDKFNETTLFQMNSHYYLIEVSDNRGEVNLTESEREMGLACEWVSLEDALINNVKLLKETVRSEWIERETLVLQIILSNF